VAERLGGRLLWGPLVRRLPPARLAVLVWREAVRAALREAAPTA
jgi:hypothetical protein